VTENAATANGWRIQGTSAVAQQLGVDVVCVAASPSTDVKDAFDGVLGYVQFAGGRLGADTGQATTTLTCPNAEPGRVALSGGYSDATGEVVVSRPEAFGWVLSLRAAAGGEANGQVTCALGSNNADIAVAAGGVGWITAVSADVKVDPGKVGSGLAACPEGSHLVGGGYELEDGTLAAVATAPTDGGWEARAVNRGTAPGIVRARAVCAV
jgi:hypothetical protein